MNSDRVDPRLAKTLPVGSGADLVELPATPPDLLAFGLDATVAQFRTNEGVPLPTHVGTPILFTRSAVTTEHPGRYSSAYPDGTPCPELGRGGIGRVYIAYDRHLGREVALKELLPDGEASGSSGVASETLTRFLREARITAQLVHPNIVAVHELGERPDGSLYYAMRVVRGRTLADALQAAPDLEGRLQLLGHFSGLCQALAYAHSRGVVHRDIKPDNVMIGEFGETVVLDWGLAKMRGVQDERADAIVRSMRPAAPLRSVRPAREVAAEPNATMMGDVFGTPCYMSPEQAAGNIEEMDERSDVFSLGAVLYTLLAGTPPFTGHSLLQVLTLAQCGKVKPLRERDRRIPRELAAIAEKALARDKADRYQSAQDLVRDVEAYRSGRRVAVYAYSSLELAQRFLARNRAATIIASVAVLALLTSAAVSYGRVVTARDRAIAAEGQALESEAGARALLADIIVDRADLALRSGDLVSAELLAAQALLIEERADARGIAWMAHDPRRPEPVIDLPKTTNCGPVAFDFAASRLFCVDGQFLRVQDGRSGSPVRQLDPKLGTLTQLAYAGDSGLLALGGERGEVAVFNASTAERIWSTKQPGTNALTWAQGSLVLGGNDGTLLILNGQSGVPEANARAEQPITALAAAPAGTEQDSLRIAVGGRFGSVQLYRDGKLGPSRDDHAGTVLALSFSSSGRFLASGGSDRVLRVRDALSNASLAVPLRLDQPVRSLAWSPDQKLIAFGGTEGVLGWADAGLTTTPQLLLGHSGRIALSEFSPDGTSFVSAGPGIGVRRWNIPSRHALRATDRGNVLAAAFSRDGKTLFTAGIGKNGVGLWSMRSHEPITRLPVSAERVRSLAVSPDGGTLAVAGADGAIALWDTHARVPKRVLQGSNDELRAVQFAPDGRVLAAVGQAGQLKLWKLATGQVVREAQIPGGSQSLAFHPNGSELVTGDRDGKLRFWRRDTLQLIEAVPAHDEWVMAVGYTPDGSRLGTAGGDAKLILWDANTRKPKSGLTRHQGRVTALVFSRDGRFFASAGEDRRILVWDAHTERLRATLVEPYAVVRSLAFAPDSRSLVSGSDDGGLRIWQMTELEATAEAVARDVPARFWVNFAGSRVTSAHSKR
jgi:WD40 repeat protein